MKRHELWVRVIATSTAIDRAVAARAKVRPLRSGPGRTEVPAFETKFRNIGALAREPELRPAPGQLVEAVEAHDRETLDSLRSKVGAELEQLWKALADQPSARRIRKALVIHFDEQVLNGLPRSLRPSWRLLQTEYTGRDTGGADFWEDIDDALDDRKAPSLLFEIYCYCLTHGFRGQNTNNLDTVERYRQRLAERIEVLDYEHEGEGSTRGRRPRNAPWPIWLYYTLALVSTVVLAVLMVVASNHPSESSFSQRESREESCGSSALSVTQDQADSQARAQTEAPP